MEDQFAQNMGKVLSQIQAGTTLRSAEFDVAAARTDPHQLIYFYTILFRHVQTSTHVLSKRVFNIEEAVQIKGFDGLMSTRVKHEDYAVEQFRRGVASPSPIVSVSNTGVVSRLGPEICGPLDGLVIGLIHIMTEYGIEVVVLELSTSATKSPGLIWNLHRVFNLLK
nr:hypothetical protein CFP56_79563 [Quercus suber]